jgi:hypothetical protein
MYAYVCMCEYVRVRGCGCRCILELCVAELKCNVNRTTSTRFFFKKSEVSDGTVKCGYDIAQCT